MNFVNLRAIGGAYAPEDALQEECDEIPPCCCPGCGLTQEEIDHFDPPCHFADCPMKGPK
jgi:hypothetical protein